jgi:thiol:disulfide interchange protein DsbD
MLGAYKLPNDYKMQENHFGIAYITLFRLFSAILAFVFVIYLLPGMWGANLPAVSGFLPRY